MQSKTNKKQTSMPKAKINIADNHKGTLREEFGCSQQTIRTSLDNYASSDLAVNIRRRAVALMEEDLKIAKEIINL